MEEKIVIMKDFLEIENKALKYFLSLFDAIKEQSQQEKLIYKEKYLNLQLFTIAYVFSFCDECKKSLNKLLNVSPEKREKLINDYFSVVKKTLKLLWVPSENRKQKNTKELTENFHAMKNNNLILELNNFKKHCLIEWTNFINNYFFQLFTKNMELNILIFDSKEKKLLSQALLGIPEVCPDLKISYSTDIPSLKKNAKKLGLKIEDKYSLSFENITTLKNALVYNYYYLKLQEFINNKNNIEVCFDENGKLLNDYNQSSYSTYQYDAKKIKNNISKSSIIIGGLLEEIDLDDNRFYKPKGKNRYEKIAKILENTEKFLKECNIECKKKSSI